MYKRQYYFRGPTAYLTNIKHFGGAIVEVLEPGDYVTLYVVRVGFKDVNGAEVDAWRINASGSTVKIDSFDAIDGPEGATIVDLNDVRTEIDSRTEDFAQIAKPNAQVPDTRLPPGADGVEFSAQDKTKLDSLGTSTSGVSRDDVRVVVDAAIAPIRRNVADLDEQVETLGDELDLLVLKREMLSYHVIDPYHLANGAVQIPGRTLRSGGYSVVYVRGYGADGRVFDFRDSDVLAYGSVNVGEMLIGGNNGLDVALDDSSGVSTGEHMAIGHDDNDNVFVSFDTLSPGEASRWEADVLAVSAQHSEFFTGQGLQGDPYDQDDPLRLDLASRIPSTVEALGSVEDILYELKKEASTTKGVDVRKITQHLDEIREWAADNIVESYLDSRTVADLVVTWVAYRYMLKGQNLSFVAQHRAAWFKEYLIL